MGMHAKYSCMYELLQGKSTQPSRMKEEESVHHQKAADADFLHSLTSFAGVINDFNFKPTLLVLSDLHSKRSNGSEQRSG